MADVCVPAERGKMLGPVMAATNLGTCIGPLIGGLVALKSGGSEWVFWCLVIFGGVILWVIGLLLPETARVVVGNGGMKATGWGRSGWSIIQERYRSRGEARVGEHERHNDVALRSDNGSGGPKTGRKSRAKVANPLVSLRILFWRDIPLVLWMGASPYAVWYCIQASIPSIYKDLYAWNDFAIGLSYLAGGGGVILGGYVNGKLMDYCYKKTAKETGHPINKTSGDDLTNFPIEKARSRSSFYLISLSTCALAGYGWAIQAHAHVSVPLVLQFILGFICTCLLQSFMTLLVDIFPENPSTASAAGNITRCALAATGVAVLQPLVDVMGRGWYFTLLSITSGVASAGAVWAIRTRGMRWRGQRLEKTISGQGGGVSEEMELRSQLERQDTDNKKTIQSASSAAIPIDHCKEGTKV